MQIIEFIGIPRSGKTTTAKYLESNHKDILFHPENHTLVPPSIWKDHFKHNFWYAKYCVDELQKALAISKVHIFERGIIDRIIIGNVCFKMGWFSKKQWDEYNAVLNPNIDKINQVFVFLIPVEESLKRAKAIGKDVKKAVPYMNALYREYKKLPEWLPKAIFLPENATLEELQNLTSKTIFNAPSL